jgi:hypothetical protein
MFSGFTIMEIQFRKPYRKVAGIIGVSKTYRVEYREGAWKERIPWAWSVERKDTEEINIELSRELPTTEMNSDEEDVIGNDGIVVKDKDLEKEKKSLDSDQNKMKSLSRREILLYKEINHLQMINNHYFRILMHSTPYDKECTGCRVIFKYFNTCDWCKDIFCDDCYKKHSLLAKKIQLHSFSYRKEEDNVLQRVCKN